MYELFYDGDNGVMLVRLVLGFVCRGIVYIDGPRGDEVIIRSIATTPQEVGPDMSMARVVHAGLFT